ncbi:hypothetical protein [Polaribacter gangjinensis]|uniref:Uncharacterized protein n=1 Tax=Polaribacter gangjinensis TaxID=574710 RepID=A0A2S7W9R3_9FLAO|nr:hypothetical protein [Polaribacter gangjinensis]PQJ74011.1 hypothetical protein BTO13_01405 [Polaribacter gangjinensis]
MITHKNIFLKEIAKALLKLIIAGVIIGVFKKYDAILAVFLFLKVLQNCYKEIIKPHTNKNWILLIGMLLTGFGGIVGETWGVHNGYWEYHEVSRELPLWLPFAWMLAFHYLYKLERNLIALLANQTQKNKIILALILALILPAFGEVITIQLGVWTYYWPYQILGVPLYAFICLVFVHMLVYLILHYICKKYQWKDAVFY